MNYLNNFRIVFFSLTLILFSCSKNVKNEEKKTTPNVVFILVDDLGWADLECYGSTFYETPNLNELANEGILFTNAYAASPVCSPTRGAILTGKYPTSINITDWIPGQNPKGTKLTGPEDLDELPLEEVTFAEVLKEEGYQTFFAGKWHLGDGKYLPENQGFDINIGGIDKGSPPGGYYSPYKNEKLPDGPVEEYLTDRLTDESIQFIDQTKEHPFLLYLSFYTVHTPIQASKKHLGKFQEKANKLGIKDPELIPEREGLTVSNQYNPDYASMVYAMDENVGRLIKKLKDEGLWENTLLIFTSDNGGLATLDKRRNAAPTSNKPLRAGKGWCYEGGIKVPLIIKPPHTHRSKIAKSETPVISMDFYPTILEMVDVKNESVKNTEGESLVPLIKGDKNLKRNEIFWHFPHYHGSAWTPGAAIRLGDWKLIEFYESGETELYNLKEDQEEKNNLNTSKPAIASKLKAKLLEMQKETGAQFPFEQNEIQ
ncbi:sulfatase [Flexithrix dorotheae]|uniref:sulfatase n=1 Tax=Flexithrix dorotheae TaxID=70993 RepID=UPI00146E63B3|nr:sulfatase [Flexithrix dorotheae]